MRALIRSDEPPSAGIRCAEFDVVVIGNGVVVCRDVGLLFSEQLIE